MATRRKSTDTPHEPVAPVGPPITMRDRIVREASRLFAAQGVKATTVAQLEAAVGLRKGSGGIHRYFPTKNDLVDAVFAEQLGDGEATYNAAVGVDPPSGHDDIRRYLDTIARMILSDAEKGREVSLILLREAATMKETAGAQIRANDDLAYGRAARSFAAAMGDQFPDIDPNALAFLFVGPLIYFRLSGWLAGEAKMGIQDDQLIKTWSLVFEPLFKQITMRSD
jgi:AcrR family transcriptional regulator